MSNDFKVGDLVADLEGLNVFPVLKIQLDDNSNNDAWLKLSSDSHHLINSECVRHATLSEKQAYYQQKIDEAQKELEKLKEPENRYPRLAHTNFYFSVEANGSITAVQDSHGYDCDDERYRLGNYFYTREEAEHEARHRGFEQQVAMFIRQREGKTLYISNSDSGGKITAYSLIIAIDQATTVFSVPANDIPPVSRGWLATNKETIQAAIDHFTPEKFIQWAKGELLV